MKRIVLKPTRSFIVALGILETYYYYGCHGASLLASGWFVIFGFGFIFAPRRYRREKKNLQLKNVGLYVTVAQYAGNLF